MSIEEFEKIDTTFNNSMFISKVNNVFVKLFSAIMMDNLKEVDHFISNDVYNFANNIIMEAKSKNARQMYDELNVKNSKILNIAEDNNFYYINVYLEARYMDYYLDLDSSEYISGNNKERIQENYVLSFIKRKDATEQSIVKKCPNCGASLSVNTSGVCPYCKSIYNQEEHDWVLNKIEKR